MVIPLITSFAKRPAEMKRQSEILDFYNAYISKICLRPCYHANGALLMQVDEELKGEIHAEMMKAILKFEIRVK